MMKKALLAATVASGLIVPSAAAGVYLPPKPAIVKPENLDFSSNLLLGMPMTMGMLPRKAPSTGNPPSVASQIATASSVNGTSHTVSLPSGIASGNLLVFVMSLGSTTAGATTLPSGWTTPVGSTGGGIAMRASFKIATGSEGSSMSVSFANSTTLTGVVYRITGNRSGTTQSTDWSGTLESLASSTAPNPASYTIGHGASANLYLATLGWSGTGSSLSSYPSGYTTGQLTTRSTATSSYVNIAAAARRNINIVTSEDVGAWGLNVANTSLSFIIALRAP